MIDLNIIGERIKEQRKHILHVSQEKMAEDLQMYQADISNIEKAKSGSGITDITKLDMISEYLNIPLESLIFGGSKNMEKYHGSKMKIKRCKKKLTKQQKEILQKRMGPEGDVETVRTMSFECGNYYLVTIPEDQLTLDHESGDFVLSIQKFHTHIFLGDELIAVMVADPTSVMRHVFAPGLQQLCEAIPHDILQPSDFYRVINPYWALYMFSDGETDNNKYWSDMLNRMDEIRATGENRIVFYLESAYVKEDCRRNGIFRMYIDFLKEMCEGCIIWMNMEPTTGAELTNEYTCIPAYTVSELGQLSLNASIAEKLGFTIDADPWHRQAETLDAEGNIKTEVVLVRKCAYFFPQEIRDLIRNDGDLVAKGYAMQKLKNENTEDSGVIDMRTGRDGDFIISEIQETITSGPHAGRKICCYAAHSEKEDKFKFGVSYRSAVASGINHDNQIEEYDYLDDAINSEYFSNLSLMNMQIMTFWHKN